MISREEEARLEAERVRKQEEESRVEEVRLRYGRDDYRLSEMLNIQDSLYAGRRMSVDELKRRKENE